MARYIDADAALKAIDNYMQSVYGCQLNEVAEFQRNSVETKTVYMAEGLYEATEIIDEIPTIEARPVVRGEWIPVEEQKPEENKTVRFYVDGRLIFVSVLVCGGQRGVTIANRLCVNPVGIPYLDAQATNGWEWSAGNDDVTHWMPLPEPPNCDADMRGETDGK